MEREIILFWVFSPSLHCSNNYDRQSYSGGNLDGDFINFLFFFRGLNLVRSVYFLMALQKRDNADSGVREAIRAHLLQQVLISFDLNRN